MALNSSHGRPCEMRSQYICICACTCLHVLITFCCLARLRSAGLDRRIRRFRIVPRQQRHDVTRLVIERSKTLTRRSPTVFHFTNVRVRRRLAKDLRETYPPRLVPREISRREFAFSLSSAFKSSNIVSRTYARHHAKLVLLRRVHGQYATASHKNENAREQTRQSTSRVGAGLTEPPGRKRELYLFEPRLKPREDLLSY